MDTTTSDKDLQQGGGCKENRMDGRQGEFQREGYVAVHTDHTVYLYNLKGAFD